MPGRARVIAATGALLTVAALIAPTPGRAAALTDPGPVLIYPLGDSITYGVDTEPPRGDSPGGYRAALDLLLLKAGVNQQFVGTLVANPSPTLKLRDQVHHDGHPGFRIDQVSADLDGWHPVGQDSSGFWITGTESHAAIYPDVVIVHLGTNDVLQSYDPAYRFPTKSGLVDYSKPGQCQQFVKDMTARLRALVEKIVAMRPGARIVLSTIVPIEATYFAPVSRYYANAIRGLVSVEQAAHRNVFLADVYSRFVANANRQTTPLPGLVAPGGVHPTPAGYQVMARVYFAAVRNALAA